MNLALRKLESELLQADRSADPVTGEAAALRALLSEKKVGNATLPAESANGNPSQDGERAADVLAFAQQHYAADVGPNGREDLTEAALRGMMSSVHDPYTVYLSPREIRGLQRVALGRQLRRHRRLYLSAQRRPDHRSADRIDAGRARRHEAGRNRRQRRRQDRFAASNIDRVEELIRGEAGTDRSPLRVHRVRNAPSAERSYAIVRDIIHVPTVRAKMEDGLDYIRLSDFGTTSADEIRKALLDGRAHGARGYILDLRDNGGGLLDAAVEISSLFIPQGTIVSTIRRDGQRTSRGRARRCDRRPPSARRAREQVHGQRFGDHRRRAARLPPRDARRHAHVRQGRRAEHLSASRRQARSRSRRRAT